MIKNLKLKIKNYNECASNIVFCLIFLFLPTQFGKHFWPSFSYIQGLRIDYLSPTIYATDILIFFLFLTTIFKQAFQNLSLASLRHRVKRGGSNLMFMSRLPRALQALAMTNSLLIVILNLFQNLYKERSKILFGMTLFVVAGILLSKSPLLGFYGLLKLAEFVFFGFYIAKNVTKNNFQIVLCLLAFGVLFQSGLSIFQFLKQSSIGGIFYFIGERTFSSQTPGIANASINGELVLRPYGTFSHPNVLAGYLLIIMILIISKFKILFGLVLIIGSIALFLTMSRVAIVLWFLIVILNLSFGKLRTLSLSNGFQNLPFPLLPRLPLARLAMTVMIIGIVFFFSPLSYRFENSLSGESFLFRKEQAIQSLLIIKDHPIFGVGLNNYLLNLSNYPSSVNNPFQKFQPVHNIFLLVLSETGIPGLIFFFWFLVKTFKRINSCHAELDSASIFYRFRIKCGMTKVKSCAFQILFIVLILGMFDHYFLTIQQGQLLLSLVLGLSWNSMVE